MNLEDAIVLVTGASRGLGRSMALRFSREGARVMPIARSRERLEELVDQAEGDVFVQSADVREPAAVERVVDRTIERYGRIDVLVNNAAIGLLSLEGELKTVQNVSADEWDSVLETNLKGPFLFTKHVLPHMLERGRGTIVNVSSAYGTHGAVGWSPYVSSKHGLEGLTKTTALETADTGITVNAITPAGSVRTGFWNTEEKRSHLPPEARDEVQDPDVMNDAMVLLAAQNPEGVTGESMSAPEWEDLLG